MRLMGYAASARGTPWTIAEAGHVSSVGTTKPTPLPLRVGQSTAHVQDHRGGDTRRAIVREALHREPANEPCGRLSHRPSTPTRKS